MAEPSTNPGTFENPYSKMTLHDTLVYKGTRVDILLRKVTLPSGKTIEREVVLHPGAILVLPVLDDGRIVMIRNRRHTVNEVLLELCAGTLEKGEDPAVCAARELTEETGYTATTLEPLGFLYTSPGILTEKMWLYVATGLSRGEQALEENEQIQVELVDPATLDRLIRENQIVDAKTLAALLKYFQRSG